jgi:hypothetical protein
MASGALMAVTSLAGNPTGDIYSLDDEAIKLVAYTIVSVRRDHECVMEGGEGTIVVAERMSGEAFALWMISKYLQEEVPDPGNPGTKRQRSEAVSNDLKYLRIYFVVSTRWPREPLRFEEREIETLQKIREELA